MAIPYRVEDLRPGMVLLMTIPASEPIWDRALDEAIAVSSGPFVHSALVGHGDLTEQLATVQSSPLDKYTANGWAYAVAGSTPAQADAAIAAFRARLGQPYSVAELLIMGAYYDLHDTGAWGDHFHYTVCSTALERAWRQAGIVLSHQPLVSPTGLAFSPTLLGPRPWDRPN